MPEPLVYLYGEFVSQSRAHLTLHDAGFVMGATVTDLCRTFRQRPFLLDEHLARFRASCAAAFIDLPPLDLAVVAEELLAHNAGLLPPEQELALVFFATPGPIGFYLGEPGGPGDAPPTVGVHTFPLPLARYRSLFTHGAHLVVPPVRQVPAACVDPRIKQRSRMHWWLADRHVRRSAPGASALLLDADGHVTETAAANFLLVRDGVVLSPPEGTVLSGSSLGFVRGLCRDLGIGFAELPLTLADCRAGSEALLCGTAFCVAGVRRIDDHTCPWPGAVLERLLAAWAERVGVDVRAQVLA